MPLGIPSPSSPQSPSSVAQAHPYGERREEKTVLSNSHIPKDKSRKKEPPSLSSSSSSFFVRVFLVKKHYASSGERREPEARLLLLLLLPLSRARRSATCIFQAVLGKGSIAGPPPVVACFYATAPCERLSLRVTLQFRIFPTVRVILALSSRHTWAPWWAVGRG